MSKFLSLSRLPPIRQISRAPTANYCSSGVDCASARDCAPACGCARACGGERVHTGLPVGLGRGKGAAVLGAGLGARLGADALGAALCSEVLGSGALAMRRVICSWLALSCSTTFALSGHFSWTANGGDGSSCPASFASLACPTASQLS
jgi:hypothetical protein